MGITGFCRGGRTVWMYDAHQSKIDAGVAWYGGLSPAEPAIKTTPLDAVAKLHGPVLGLYGGADQGIPQEQVDKLSAALKASGNKKAKDSTIHVYPGMPHGFNADYRPELPQGRGGRRLEAHARVVQEERGGIARDGRPPTKKAATGGLFVSARKPSRRRHPLS